MKPREPFHFLTAGGALDLTDNFNINQHRFLVNPLSWRIILGNHPGCPEGRNLAPVPGSTVQGCTTAKLASGAWEQKPGLRGMG